MHALRLVSALTAAIVAASGAPSVAAGYDPAPDIARAAAYWQATPATCLRVRVEYNQALVGGMGERAGGCVIYIGDIFLGYPAAQKCQTITHGLGHLLGWGEDHAWHPGLPADPANVMVTFNLPPQCAELVPPAPVVPAPTAALAAWAKFDADYVAWTERRTGRSNCTVAASERRRRAARVAARRRCVTRYGRIVRGPATPAMPRPA